MAAATATYARPFTPEERASFLAWRFGSTLDWRNAILTELDYPLDHYWFVDAVQGIAGKCRDRAGRISHGVLAKRAQRFKNKLQAKTLVLRAIAEDREWARLSCRMIFDIERPKPHEREGKDKRARTLYTDYLTPACVWAQETEQKLKKSNEVRWKKDTKYRLEQRRQILAEALKLLPGFERAEDMPASTQAKEKTILPLREYVKQRGDIIAAEGKRINDKLTEGDLISPEEIDERLTIGRVAFKNSVKALMADWRRTRAMLEGLRQTTLQRAANLFDAAEVVADVDEILAEKGNAHVPLATIDTDQPTYEEVMVNNNCKGNAHVPLSAPAEQPKAEKKGNTHVPLVTPPPAAATSENIMLQEALAWAGAGVAVFPVYEIFDGVCACPKGSECGRNAGKHPRWHADDLPNGKDNATTDPAQITTWWTRWPFANIAGRMGGAANIVALDVDPRNGGSASLHDLVEAYGEEWLQTRSHKTGGGGNHFFLTLSEGVEVHRATLAPGIDVKHGNGYVLLPPSTHASGASYEVENDAPILRAPAQMEAELTRARDAQPATVINFQDGKDRRAQFGAGARFFGEGERNDGLRDVMCGRWVHGWAVDAQDLYQQVREVRDARCAFVPGDPPPTDRELWDMAQRTTQKYARGELRKAEVTA